MSSPATYLVTGANRGIGKGFIQALLQRPNSTVIAAVRDIAKATPILNELPKATSSKLIIIKLDFSIESDPKDAIAKLQSGHNITSLDVVIANAGIAHSGTKVVDSSADAIRDHFNINTIGPVLLFQAVKPLLQASKTGNPIFLAISTGLGSLAAQEALSAFPYPYGPYGVSKAALNYLVRRIHIEETWLTAYVTHPGLVKTDMAPFLNDPSIDVASLGGAIEVEESVEGILKTLGKANREIGGTFQNYDGSIFPW
ncbi:aflatoxin biosynthesis ketoreductase nor-1 [Setomelanomma holmii]|uniref:Aflatoxin biosynthesis ketoreductase nor-1 n=1 Tax=Setomelanomma holmii TaxID=210430 RepID=A0A9P4H4D8_9PLEO|nr:aflatoxin biosynthesis ketoreductase nor-1 [Setomelanomma holmii]